MSNLKVEKKHFRKYMNDTYENAVRGYFHLPNGKRFNIKIIDEMKVYVKSDNKTLLPLTICPNPTTKPIKEKSNYMVKFVIDDGYAQYNHTCIISAEDKKSAYNILHDRIGKSLKGERFIVDKYTEITKCEDDVIIYDSTKPYKWKKKSVYC